MKTNYLINSLLFLLLIFGNNLDAQINLPRASQQASVSQRIGISDVSITYARPSVNGREIWGKLVPFGMNDLGFGTSKAAPWRAGANENTIISFTHDAKLEGKEIKAGTYGLHIEVVDENNANIILSYDTDSWGSYFYDEAKDALKVGVKMNDVPHKELLTYEVNTVDANSAIVSLVWEKKEIPFKVAFDVSNLVLSDFRSKSKGNLGFMRQNWEQAANYALNNNGDLNEALGWIDGAIAGNFYSQKTFNNLQIKAQILEKLGKADEASNLMDEALSLATIFQVHQYGRTLIAKGEKDKAMEVFKMNAKNNKGQWPVHYGLARALSAKGDYKTALKHLKIALGNAPNDASRGRVQANIEKLEKGIDIN
ncbi:DUF2911 domain-containing protein [Seonamhaeicola sp.]|uniref:DUF2911 domain-containing protein n=1 Tax=Seonamhaeicola sp. TaxID=1912245 RepID=UPI002607F54F|nr:DUF2911 domain-containing protein [Seonamhaeicola sp.]